MKGFLKRLGVLAVCMLLVCAMSAVALAAPAENCPGSCSHEVAIGTTHYDTLAEALGAATDGVTVTVLKDISNIPLLTVDKAITLDLGGKTLHGEGEPDKALLTVTKDITVTNGTLSCGGYCLTATDCTVTIDASAILRAPMSITGSNGTATVNFNGTMISSGVGVSSSARNNANCIINIGQTAAISTDNHAVTMWGKGRLNIAGGTISSKKNAVLLHISENQTMEASITGGNFQVTNDETIVITAETNATAPAGFVTGGTFNKVPTAYLGSNCRTQDNGNGTYTVIVQAGITYAPNGGSGSMTGITADKGTSVVLPNCTFTAPAGKHFAGWEIGGKTYAPGASYTVNGDLTMKALWASHSGGTATCLSLAKCSTCGTSYGSYNRHNLVANSGSAATCTEKGMNSHSRCTTCGQCFVSGVVIKASSLTIPALGHEMQTVEGKAATCTEDGLLTHSVCAHCGQLEAEGKVVTEEQLLVPATGHTTEPVAAVEATCTQPGTKAHERCTGCDTLFVNGSEVTPDTLTTPVQTHILSDWETDASTHWKTCTGCGEEFRRHSHSDSDVNNTCDDCGYSMAPAQQAAPQEEDTVAFPFLIPVIAAVIIAIGGVVLAVKKKSK